MGDLPMTPMTPRAYSFGTFRRHGASPGGPLPFPRHRPNLSDLNGFMVDWRGTETVYIWLLVARHAVQPTSKSIPTIYFEREKVDF